MSSEGASIHFSFAFCFFVYLGLTGPVSMGAKGELCEEHRFWHGELASCVLLVKSLAAIFSCLHMCVNVLYGTWKMCEQC